MFDLMEFVVAVVAVIVALYILSYMGYVSHHSPMVTFGATGSRRVFPSGGTINPSGGSVIPGSGIIGARQVGGVGGPISIQPSIPSGALVSSEYGNKTLIR